MLGRGSGACGWLVALLVAGCTSTPDGPPVLTISDWHSIGMVVSEPPGIFCGTCNDPTGHGAPCPAGPTSRDTCSFTFTAGTEVSLAIGGQSLYFDTVCWFPPATTETLGCRFVVEGPVTVGIRGLIAVR